MTETIAWAIVMSLGVGVAQDAAASILYYLKTSETWHYNHACRLVRLVAGIGLIGIAIWGLV